MADATPARKSARGRVPNKKYSNEAIEILNNILSSDSDADVELPPKLDTSEDEDFRSDAILEESEADDDDIASGSDALSDGSGVATPEEDFEDALSYADPDDLLDIGAGPRPIEGLLRRSGLYGSTRIGRKKNPDTHLHFRGLPGAEKGSSKASHIKSLIGTDPKDLQNFSRAREKWTQDATLPTRKSDKYGRGGMGDPIGHEKEFEEAEAEWNWYLHHGGKQAMSRIQSLRVLEAPQFSNHIPRSHPEHNFLMGPYGNQKLCSLRVGEVASLDELWRPMVPPIDEDNGHRNYKAKKGWMLNVGAKIRCLDWAPGHSGKTQYLALAPTCNPPSKFEAPTAFDPSERYPTCIQLWAFSAIGEPYPVESMNMSEPPQLVQVLCTNWGAPRQLRWCPAPRALPNESEEDKILVGLLAGIWSDGYVRVLDIQLDVNANASNTHVLYENASFSSIPPTTICTSLTWLSPSELAVGCANGFVAIWGISESILSSAQQPTSTRTNSPPQPHFYQPLHQSYVLSLSSNAPHSPRFLASTSIDGYLRLTDLRAPTTDYVLSLRSRIMNPATDYHPHIQSFLAPDENDFLKALPLRRFFSMITFARAEGYIMDLGVGKVHASVLVGGADGSAMVTNPMRKIWNPKASQWQLAWFKHEWVHKAKPSSTAQGVNVELHDGGEGDADDTWPLPRPGMSRITEGYKVDSLQLLKSARGEGKRPEGAPFSTIYEEESGVTQVCWNPNLHCGGWAAAGMGSGLVRVEDLAI